MSPSHYKVLGYGFTDLSTIKEEDDYCATVDDDRLAIPLDYDVLKKDFEEFRDWVLNERGEVEEVLEDLGDFCPSVTYRLEFEPLEEEVESYFDFITHTKEGGDSSVLVFTPFGMTDEWVRRGDTIAIYDHQVRNGGYGKGRVIDLFHDHHICGIYPYDQHVTCHPDHKKSFKDLFEEVDEEVENYLDNGIPSHTYTILRGWRSEESKPMVEGEFLDHIKTHWTPELPLSLRVYFQRSDLFEDLQPIHDMVPILYEYWS